MNSKKLLPFAHLTQLLKQANRPFVMRSSIISVDGPGGAGKSTLASRIAHRLQNCPVIHTDDFASWNNQFEWWQDMLRQVLEPFSNNQTASYQRYDWTRRELADWIS